MKLAGKTEKISKAATSNISGMLLGRAAGLQATVASPQPGGGINISIRGGGTPIYVVDGVVMPSGSFEVGTGSTSLPSSVNRAGLAGLNPNDIESIEILKYLYFERCFCRYLWYRSCRWCYFGDYQKGKRRKTDHCV